ncbi:MAG: DNA translocase FtsK [Treponema sp.]
MKKSRVSQIIAGIIFFVLAVFFSFSLLFSIFNAENLKGGFSGFMIKTGLLIKNSYGICCLLIPVFFFTVSMICLISDITFKTCIYISSSLIPFFTAVASQNLYKASASSMHGPIQIVKLVLTVISTILIMAIEFLLSGIIAERLVFRRNSKLRAQKKEEAEPDFNTAVNDVPLYDGFSSSQTLQNKTQDTTKADTDIIFENLQKSTDENFSFESTDTDQTEQIEENAIPDFTLDQPDAEPLVSDDELIEQESETSEYNDEYDESDETDEIDENDIIYNLEDESNYADDFDSGDYIDEDEYHDIEKSDFEDDNAEYNKDDFQTETPAERSDLTMVKTDLDDTHGISDIFSQMDREIRENINSARAIQNDIQDNFKTDGNADEDEIAIPEFDPDENDENQDEESDINFETDFSSDTDEYQNEESDIEFDTEQESDINSDTEPEQISMKEAAAEIRQEKSAATERRKGPYKIPTEGLLEEFEDQKYWVIDSKTNDAAAQLKETLNEFKISAEVTGIRKGPVVTMFEILPAPGVKLSKIVALQDNIALRLAASSVRIVAPIPGKRAVGIEVPNEDRAIVTFRELIEQNLSEYKKMAIPVVLGKDIQGEAQFLDIAKTPHLLIAGSTGSGKSVCVNSIILSILYKRSPNEVKLILVDPKIVELKLYNDIPHLLTPVITEPKKALQSLQYCLCEMERRYALLDGLGVRDIINYNKRVEERHIATEKLPYIVVIIDEFADLMATTGKELESTIARLCAMSRAVGIHLVLATQRPSIDVITGLIKANIPSRIAFMVASKTDSRIIIDQVGAEKLLGRGDMLYASATDPFPVRIQGTYVSDQEVENVVEYVKGFGEPEYIDDEIFVEDEDDEFAEPSLFDEGDDPLYNKALEIVIEAGKASASYIQRRLKVGYNRAARLVEEMEARGIVGPANGSKPREIINVP